MVSIGGRNLNLIHEKPRLRESPIDSESTKSRADIRPLAGKPYPLGATWDGRGVNFAVFSQHATSVELCLYCSESEGVAVHGITLFGPTEDVWHIYVEGIGPGQHYGFRADGPYRPMEGHRFNRHKLLIDPYARAITGSLKLHDAIFGYTRDHADGDLSFDDQDSAPFVPKSFVIDPTFEWGGDTHPNHSWTETLIYECHVKGMTARHPDVSPELRGTYLGLVSEPILDHFRQLGVTTVELLPVHQFVDSPELTRRGLTEYWGYNTVGFFAPQASYATGTMGQQVYEFKEMVRRFHQVGIEVILDVVFNHAGEGDHLGPTVGFRGLDNATYYRLEPSNQSRYINDTGCGNTINASHPRVLQLIMDSLRYWADEMHVDGFRFDLATVLMRNERGVDANAPLLSVILQDPKLQGLKWIAETWDLGPNGYFVGKLRTPWREWNDQYRDVTRRFWRGEKGLVGPLAAKLSGSSEIFQPSCRGPFASVNFITCHDGFTLADLVSYDHKHNECNGENNRDGTDRNYSCNWGIEGPTDQAEITNVRDRIQRSMLATLAFSLGVPMISMGDEIGRTQRGNNNAYCQDNETAWMNWRLDPKQRQLHSWMRRLLAIRHCVAEFHRDRYFEGRIISGIGMKDVTWVSEAGREMSESDWHDQERSVVGMLIATPAQKPASEMPDASPKNQSTPRQRKCVLVLFNGSDRDRDFRLPEMPRSGAWTMMLDSAVSEIHSVMAAVPSTHLLGHTVQLLEFVEFP